MIRLISFIPFKKISQLKNILIFYFKIEKLDDLFILMLIYVYIYIYLYINNTILLKKILTNKKLNKFNNILKFPNTNSYFVVAFVVDLIVVVVDFEKIEIQSHN
jgi:hypothetical protein